MFEFQLITPAELETLRCWRNHPHNAHWFEFKEEITQEAQQRWFANLDKKNCWYFTYRIEGHIFAFFHLKRQDQSSKTAECGLITNPEIQTGSGAILQGSLQLLEFAFENQHLNTLRAKVNCLNTAALKYNRDIGFIQQAIEDKLDFCWMELTKEHFVAQKVRLQALTKYIG